MAWHTMDSFDDGNVLVFGGDGGVEMPIQTRNDSTWLISLTKATATSLATPVSSNVAYTQQSTSNQPIRKIYAASSAFKDHQTIYLTGGQKADGSGLGYSEAWLVTLSSQQMATYTPLPSLPTDLVHHQSILLSNGTLILLGGYIPSTSSFLPLNQAYVMDTSNTATTTPWRTMVFSSSSSSPVARRGHTATLITAEDGTEQIVLIGGVASPSPSSPDERDVLDDVWILDPARGEWQQISNGQSVSVRNIEEDPKEADVKRRVERDVSGGPGGRYDHTAQVVGGQVVVFGGKHFFPLFLVLFKAYRVLDGFACVVRR